MTRWFFAFAVFLWLVQPAYSTDKGTYRDLNTALFDHIKRGRTKESIALLKQGANLEARDRIGNTALLLAARTARSKLVKKLIEMGANINHQNLIGSTAILRASTADRGKNVAILLNAGAEINVINNKGLTPLAAAAFNGDEETFRLLFEAGAVPDVVDNSGKSAIIYAAAKGFTGIVTVLLDTGIDVNKRYGNDLTALMWAAGYSNDVPPGDAADMIRLLLAHDAALDLQDNRGWSALMTAANMGHLGVVEVLLKAGADVHLVASDGQTASKLARAAGHLETLTTLNAVIAN